MTERFCLDLASPAQGFMDSFLLGNGRLGATLRSAIGQERIDINLDRFWSGGPETGTDTPSPANLLPELRQAIRDGDAALADQLSQRMQGSGQTQSYQPTAALLWRFDRSIAAYGVTNYRRRLNLSTAMAEYGYDTPAGHVRLTSFVSRRHDVCTVVADGDGLLSFAEMGLEWLSEHPVQSHAWSEGAVRWQRVEGRAPKSVIPPYVETSDPIQYDDKAPEADGTVASGMGFVVVAALVAQPDGGARLTIAGECGFRGPFERPSADLELLARTATARVKAALQIDPAALQKQCVDDYRQFFDRNSLYLPSRPELGEDDPARAELLYHFGRYLLISSSQPGTEPANLQGIWNPYVRPAWSSNHTTNINTEMNYWPAEPTGLGDLVAPYNAMVSELVEAGKATAHHYYGAPGSVVHHNTDLWRFTRPVEGTPVWANWTGALPWLLVQCWDHWAYGSGDDRYAREQLLPMLAEVSRFILFMLVEDASGALVFSPSSSPEHCFIGPDGQAWGVTEGAAMDQQLSAQAMRRLIELSSRFGLETQLAEQCSVALAKLARPSVDAKGRAKEWAGDMTGAEPGHRHLSHLYSIYPGDGQSIFADPDALGPERRGLAHRLEHGTGHTGWSQAWVLCMAARLGDTALVQSSVRTLLNRLTTRALLVLHPYEGMPDSSVFQIDGNFGATAGIAECVLQSFDGLTVLLPAVPSSWNEGQLSGGVIRGGHRVDLAWSDGLLTRAQLSALRDTLVTLNIPAGASYHLSNLTNASETLTADVTPTTPGRQQLCWQAQSGQIYELLVQQR